MFHQHQNLTLNDMKTKTAILLMLLVALICLLAGMHIEYKHIEKNRPEPVIDTTSRIDTVYLDAPIPDVVIPDGFELVPVGTLEEYVGTCEELMAALAKKPTVVTIRDTTYIKVPMSNYHFTDSTTYEMAVRGYNVDLLWHKSFQETKYITKTEYVTEYKDYGLVLYPKISTFGTKGLLGATAGIGADIALGNKGIIRFEPEVGYNILWTDQGLSHGAYVGGAIKVNAIRIR